MLASVFFGLTSWQRMTGHRVSAGRERGPSRRSRTRPSIPPGEKRSVVQRLEDRWQRRQEDR
jgi:hypothetical protein